MALNSVPFGSVCNCVTNQLSALKAAHGTQHIRIQSNRGTDTLFQITGTNKYGVYEGFIVIPIKNASDILLPPHETGHALKMLHPKDEAVLDGENRADTPELPYMLMSRTSTSVCDASLSKWMVNEFSAKRFVKKDLAKLSASPRPLFILSFP